MRLGDAAYRDVPGRGDMPGRVPGDPQYAEDGPEDTSTHYVRGIEVDRETKTFAVLGVRIPVGNLERVPYTPPRDRAAARAAMAPDMQAVLDELLPNASRVGTIPQMPEAIHVTLLCGENGWWVEAGIYPGPEGGYTPGIVVSFPDKYFDRDEDGFSIDHDAEYLLRAWRETCDRRDAVPAHLTTPDMPGPFGGMEPGTWTWDDDDG